MGFLIFLGVIATVVTGVVVVVYGEKGVFGTKLQTAIRKRIGELPKWP